MFVEIDNEPRDYAWGSVHAIAELLGRPASGHPEAEVWLGSHPMSPSKIVNPTSAGGAANLEQLLTQHPEFAGVTIGSDGLARLPFLLKVLAAETALSIQVHPSMTQAQVGFERENTVGIPLDAPHRNYRDASHKPELIFCVSDSFDALSGFRSAAQTISSLRAFISEAQSASLPFNQLEMLITAVQSSPSTLRPAVEFALAGDRDTVSQLVTQLVDISTFAGPHSAIDRDASTVRMLNAEYPGDPGIVVAFLMNRVTLRKGQAMFVPHGVLHAYLNGLGIEIMAASDNVLRGGLTSKHVDVAELMSVGDFTPSEPQLMTPEIIGSGIHRYAPGVAEFELLHVTVTDAGSPAEFRLDGPSIVLCTAGHAHVAGRHSDGYLRRGQSWFVTPDEETLRIGGSAELFIARTGR